MGVHRYIIPIPPKQVGHSYEGIIGRWWSLTHHLRVDPGGGTQQRKKHRELFWLVVLTHLKNISQNGNLPQVGMKIKTIWNHHLDFVWFGLVWFVLFFLLFLQVLRLIFWTSTSKNGWNPTHKTHILLLCRNSKDIGELVIGTCRLLTEKSGGQVVFFPSPRCVVVLCPRNVTCNVYPGLINPLSV